MIQIWTPALSLTAMTSNHALNFSVPQFLHRVVGATGGETLVD